MAVVINAFIGENVSGSIKKKMRCLIEGVCKVEECTLPRVMYDIT